MKKIISIKKFCKKARIKKADIIDISRTTNFFAATVVGRGIVFYFPNPSRVRVLKNFQLSDIICNSWHPALGWVVSGGYRLRGKWWEKAGMCYDDEAQHVLAHQMGGTEILNREEYDKSQQEVWP